MKIAVTADAHLTTEKEHPERYRALENILYQMDSAGNEHLIIAGDLFDKGVQNYSEFEALCRKHPGVKFHIIPGNHDPCISGKSIVGDNIHVYIEPTLMEIGPASFLFLPYEENANMGEKIAEVEDRIIERKWVLVAHGDYYGGVKEQNPLEPGTYMPLSRKDVERFQPQTVLLGHIHRPMELDGVHYIGSSCGLDINETGKRRFLVYDTDDGSLIPLDVETDVLFFSESFVILPRKDEVVDLEERVRKRIDSWNITAADDGKVRVRVRATGYSSDRQAILETLNREFSRFRFFKDEGPDIEKLSSSTDQQLGAIAERVRKLIDKLDWNFGGDEPDEEEVVGAALSVIYGEGGR